MELYEFKFYQSYTEIFDRLSDEDSGKLIKRMQNFYFRGDDTQSESVIVEVVFSQIKYTMEKSIQGKATGSKRTTTPSTVPSTVPSTTPTTTRTTKDKEQVQVQDKDKVKEEEKVNNSKELELKLSVVPDKFLDKDLEVTEYGNKEINGALEFLKKAIGIDDFKESKPVQRQFGNHIVKLRDKIGNDDLKIRIVGIVSDNFKRKNCNSIQYLYRELKSYIHEDAGLIQQAPQGVTTYKC